MEINYLAVLVCGVISMVTGFVWYVPLFGKKWQEVIGTTNQDLEARKKMQKEAGPLYALQFVLTLIQVYFIANLMQFLVNNPSVDAPVVFHTIIFWIAFIMPTIAGSSMWNNDSAKMKWTRFLIQSGYQLLNFVIFGLVLGMWI